LVSSTEIIHRAAEEGCTKAEKGVLDKPVKHFYNTIKFATQSEL